MTKFLEAFFTTTLQRLSTAWDRSVLSPLPTFTAEQQFAWRVYRMCNIPEGFDGLSAGFSAITTADGEAFDGFSREEIENARDHLIGEATRSFADVLAALFGLRGFLFTPHASAATAAAAEYMQLTPTARSGAGGGGGVGAPGKGAGLGEAAPSAVRKSNTSIIITGKWKTEVSKAYGATDRLVWTDISSEDLIFGGRGPQFDFASYFLDKVLIFDLFSCVVYQARARTRRYESASLSTTQTWKRAFSTRPPLRRSP